MSTQYKPTDFKYSFSASYLTSFGDSAVSSFCKERAPLDPGGKPQRVAGGSLVFNSSDSSVTITDPNGADIVVAKDEIQTSTESRIHRTNPWNADPELIEWTYNGLQNGQPADQNVYIHSARG